MDVSATLPNELLALFSDPSRSLEETGKIYTTKRQREIVRNPEISEVEATFTDSLKLKNKLDELESWVPVENILLNEVESTVVSPIALILNCEFQLYKLNASTPLRHNPFLSHWVEVLRKWQPIIVDEGVRRNVLVKLGLEGLDGASQAWLTVHGTRLRLVKWILHEHSEDVSRYSPEALWHLYNKSPFEQLDVEPYIKILEDEDIYDKPHSTNTGAAGPPSPPTSESNSRSSTDDIGPIDETTEPQSTPVPGPGAMTIDSLIQRLSSDPLSTRQTLTRLPLDIPSLELFTTLLQSDHVYTLSIDPAGLVRDYIQQGLRSLEVGNIADGGEAALMDREDRRRAVRLLVLFIKNLLKRDLIPYGEILMEIQEICVRFIWVAEVRTFKRWLEEGVDEDIE